MFRKSNGTAYVPTDGEMKTMTLLKAGKHMHTMFEYIGNVHDTDTLNETVEKVQLRLMNRQTR